MDLLFGTYSGAGIKSKYQLVDNLCVRKGMRN